MDHPEPLEPTEWHASPALKRSILSGAAGWVDAKGAVAWPPRGRARPGRRALLPGRR